MKTYPSFLTVDVVTNTTQDTKDVFNGLDGKHTRIHTRIHTNAHTRTNVGVQMLGSIRCSVEVLAVIPTIKNLPSQPARLCQRR